MPLRGPSHSIVSKQVFFGQKTQSSLLRVRCYLPSNEAKNFCTEAKRPVPKWPREQEHPMFRQRGSQSESSLPLSDDQVLLFSLSYVPVSSSLTFFAPPRDFQRGKHSTRTFSRATFWRGNKKARGGSRVPRRIRSHWMSLSQRVRTGKKWSNMSSEHSAGLWEQVFSFFIGIFAPLFQTLETKVVRTAVTPATSPTAGTRPAETASPSTRTFLSTACKPPTNR